MVVPRAVRRKDEVAARRLATVALGDGVAAFVGQSGAASVRRVQMHGGDVAGIVDRNRAADGVGDLQPAIESWIEQQNALPVGEFNGRYVCLARNLGNAMQVRTELI